MRLIYLTLKDMEKFTIKQFRERFPNDNACLAELFKIRYGHMKECPKCEHKAEYVRVKTRKCYHCRYCYHQIYPTAGTIFHKSTTPLKDWFFVMFLMTSTRNGVASKEVERLLGCTYKTALRMTHQIRKLMSGKDKDKLAGFVEMDESWVGGTPGQVTMEVNGKSIHTDGGTLTESQLCLEW